MAINGLRDGDFFNPIAQMRAFSLLDFTLLL